MNTHTCVYIHTHVCTHDVCVCVCVCVYVCVCVCVQEGNLGVKTKEATVLGSRMPIVDMLHDTLHLHCQCSMLKVSKEPQK